jgi:hypothetical protein
MHPTLSTTQRGHLQRLCLTNGITLLVGQNAAVEILAAHCFFRGGSRVEQPQQAGLSQLLAAVLTKGTRQRDSQAIAAWVESLGASLSVDSAADHFEVALRCVAEDFPELLQLLAEILRDPSFPEAEVARERDLMLLPHRHHQKTVLQGFPNLVDGATRPPYCIAKFLQLIQIQVGIQAKDNSLPPPPPTFPGDSRLWLFAPALWL